MRIILVAAFPIAVREHEGGCLKTPVHGKANGQRVGMRREIRANYDHLDLLPQALGDWVPQNHPTGFIREFVDAPDVVGCDFDGGRVKGGTTRQACYWRYGCTDTWRVFATRGS